MTTKYPTISRLMAKVESDQPGVLSKIEAKLAKATEAQLEDIASCCAETGGTGPQPDLNAIYDSLRLTEGERIILETILEAPF